MIKSFKHQISMLNINLINTFHFSSIFYKVIAAYLRHENSSNEMNFGIYISRCIGTEWFYHEYFKLNIFWK